VLDTEDAERWRVVVLEDAEALLHTSTKAASALGKLLNLADGMLGQGLRCLFLLTTNEPVGALHPALVRPGRCLARIEFTALSAAETAALLGRPVDRGQTLAEVMAARAVATEEAAEAVGQYL
jgi:ATP-dependent 26S proteasome regulatory subunit